MKLTKKKAYKLHYELWDWLYNHPLKEKRDWPGWDWNGGDYDMWHIFNSCFLCEFLLGQECVGCPLNIDEISCYYPSSWFQKWAFSVSPKTRKKYAKLIRDAVL